MNPYDAPVPEDDAIAGAARRTLGALARSDAPGHFSWETVQSGARRVQQRRLAAGGAACAIVLVGASAAVAAIGGDTGNHLDVAGPGSPASSTSEPAATTTLPWDSSSAAPTTPDGSVPIPAADPTTPVPVEPTTPVALRPQDGSWSASMSVDTTPVIVGDLVTVRAKLRNTGTQPQQTNGDESLAVTCERSIMSHFGAEAAPGWPVAQFLEPVIMVSGESRSFSMTFRADQQQVGGSAACNVGLGYGRYGDHARTFASRPSDTAFIEIVAPPDPSTTTSSTIVPETTTTTMTP